METEQELKRIFGENVKIRRKRLGLTQEQLSEKMGSLQEKLSEKTDVSKNTISDIEGGQKFARAKTLVYLAKALETEVYELLKPADIKPDKAADIIADYADEVRDAVGEIEKKYMENTRK